MSPPPINIDGSDITGATIDGQEVQEITVDGQSVFQAVTPLPSSTLIQVDASQESFNDGQTISTATDFSGNNNSLTGSATYESNAMNGLPVFRTDGSTDVLDNTNLTLNRPATFMLVIKADSTQFGSFFSTTDSGGDRAFVSRGSGEFGLNYFSNIEGRIKSGSQDFESQLVTFRFISSGSVLRRNGSTLGTAGGASNPWPGVRLAQQYNLGNQQLAADFAEFRVFDADLASTGELNQQEQQLIDKWGITI